MKLVRYLLKSKSVLSCTKCITTCVPIKINQHSVVSLATNRIFNNQLKVYTYASLNSYRYNSDSMQQHVFEKVCNETLESLGDYIEQLIDTAPHLKQADVSLADGVLTVNFGEPYGTYVINKQTPNRQIWLSSPKSGPKRYDFIEGSECWVYKHDGISLHKLLEEELSDIVKDRTDFSKCSYSKYSAL